MHRLIAGMLCFVLPHMALASCPATPTDCPSPTFNNATVGGALGVTGDATIASSGITITIGNSGATTTIDGALAGTALAPLFASPPAIGGTAPAAGSFTTLAASSTISGTGVTSLFASPPAIGGTAAAAGTFTAVTAPSLDDAGALTVGATNATSVGVGKTGVVTTLSGTLKAPDLGVTPGSKQPVCIDTSTFQLYYGSGGAC